MAGNLLPILLLGGGALLVMGKKKKKKKAVDTTPVIVQPTAELPPMVAPPTKKKTASSTTWKKRQQSLIDTGFDVGPSGADGKPGPDTREAVKAFQKAAGITIDGKWGPQTAAAMAQALKMAVEGVGKAAYSQIGGMLGKFADTFKKFGQGKESEDSGLPLEEQDVFKEQLFVFSAIHNNQIFDPDNAGLEQAILQFQMHFGLEATGTATLETRIKLNEAISEA